MRVLLVGAPNSGKTSLFNWLTGLSAKAVNYPGSTVEVSRGRLASHWLKDAKTDLVEIVDSPGVFGLASNDVTQDELVTRRALRGENRFGAPHVVVAVIDATQLERQMLILQQLREMGVQPIVVFTMADMFSDLHRRALAQKIPNVIWIDGRLGGGVDRLTQAIANSKNEELKDIKTVVWSEIDYVNAQQKVRALLSGDIQDVAVSKARKVTRIIDGILLNAYLALPMLFVVMSLLFTAVFVLAAPAMDLVDSTFANLAQYVTEATGGALWGLFLSEGIITGFGAFLVFVPQIAILFLVLSFLEGSGYLARTVILMDRPFTKVGLSGRSLVPVLVGFACAIPAMMATRTISSKRDRWITNFIIPLLTCSARLPVFALLIGILWVDAPAWQKGMAMAGMYFLSLVIGGVAALILDRIIPRTAVNPLAIELPLYRWPQWGLMVRQTWYRTRSFIENAAPVIFVLTILIWGLSRFPQHENLAAEQQLEQSYLGQVGQFMNPVFQPMGVDWRVGIALLSSFAAREVFVSTLALVIAGSADTEEASLINSLGSATDSAGLPIISVAAAAGLLIFFVIALQCASTVAVAYRESGSWKFAVGQLISFNVIAYVLAVMTYSILK